MPKLLLSDLDLTNKRVLIRVDFNVPLKDGVILDDTRMVETLPTIEYALRHKAKVILASHLGRPKGKVVAALSLRPLVDHLRMLLDHRLDSSENVAFSPDCVGSIAVELATQLESGQTLLLENLRFHPEEEANDPGFAAQLAELCDIFVNDAFGTAHRAHASTEGITHHVAQSAAGFLLEKEMTFLGKVLTAPDKPFVAIIGGSKVSDKIEIVNSLLDKADTILIGGAMAYTFLNAQGQGTGKSLAEPDKQEVALAALAKAKERGVKFLLPVDHLLADKFAADARTQVFSGTDAFPAELMALDIGPATVELFSVDIARAQTVLWNGPMGVFEIDAFAAGTNAVAEAVAGNIDAVTIVGGEIRYRLSRSPGSPRASPTFRPGGGVARVPGRQNAAGCRRADGQIGGHSPRFGNQRAVPTDRAVLEHRALISCHFGAPHRSLQTLFKTRTTRDHAQATDRRQLEDVQNAGRIARLPEGVSSLGEGPYAR